MTGATDATGAAAVPLLGKKYMNKLGAMVNEGAASEMSAFARRQMEKMGWTQGKGLGKEEQGMATYVRVKKREESMGIGVETVKIEEQKNQWWYNAYDKLADKIKIAVDSDDEAAAKKSKKKRNKKEKKAKKDKKRKRGSDSDSSDAESTSTMSQPKKFRVPTDEELFAATGGKLFGRRAYGSCVGKLKRDALHVSGKISAVSTPSADKNKSITSSSNESTSSADEADNQTKPAADKVGSSRSAEENTQEEMKTPSTDKDVSKKSRKKQKKSSKKL